MVDDIHADEESVVSYATAPLAQGELNEMDLDGKIKSLSSGMNMCFFVEISLKEIFVIQKSESYFPLCTG